MQHRVSFSPRASAFLATILVLILAPLTGTSTAQTGLTDVQTFDFSLAPGETSRTWEVRFDLSEEEVRRGVFFIGRKVQTTNSLEMVSEALTRTRYVLKLHLSRGFMAYGTGRLHIRLDKGTPIEEPPLLPPTGLSLGTAPYSFPLRCDFQGTYVSVTVFKRSSGAPLWERILGDNSVWAVPSDPIVVGGRYLLMASQCGLSARYSPPALLGFRIEATHQKCRTCDGTGWLGPLSLPKDSQPGSEGELYRPETGEPEERKPEPIIWPGTKGGLPVLSKPDNQEISGICPYCRGTGVLLHPFPVEEPALPEEEPGPVCAETS